MDRAGTAVASLVVGVNGTASLGQPAPELVVAPAMLGPAVHDGERALRSCGQPGAAVQGEAVRRGELRLGPAHGGTLHAANLPGAPRGRQWAGLLELRSASPRCAPRGCLRHPAASLETPLGFASLRAAGMPPASAACGAIHRARCRGWLRFTRSAGARGRCGAPPGHAGGRRRCECPSPRSRRRSRPPRRGGGCCPRGCSSRLRCCSRSW